MSMATSHTILSMYLQRSSNSQEETDDQIRIRGAGDQFEVSYLDGETKRTHRSNFSRMELLSYISILLHALSIDSSPFYSVQVMPSGFPTIMYSITDIEVGSPGWETLTATMKSAINGRWTILPRASTSSVQSHGTSVPSYHSMSSVAPEFVPLTARVSLQPQSAPQHSFVWAGEESLLDVTS